MRAVSLHFMHENFSRPHKTITKRYGTPTTPAMGATAEPSVVAQYELDQEASRVRLTA
jgi:hypothetical protein